MNIFRLSSGPTAVSTLTDVVEMVCVYFSPPSSPSLCKQALTVLCWSLIVSRHSTETTSLLVRCQVNTSLSLFHAVNIYIDQVNGIMHS